MEERERNTMYDFHNSTEIFVNPLFLLFCTPKTLLPELALKTGILVPKDLPEFKISPWDHIATIIHT